MAKLHRFTVKVKPEASFRSFPVDMLRYDSLVPKTETSAYGIVRSIEDNYSPAEGPIELTRLAESSWRPTEGRWKSFGWLVVDIAKDP